MTCGPMLMRISFRCCFGAILEEATYPSSCVVVLRFLAFRLHFVFALGIMMMDRLIALTTQRGLRRRRTPPSFSGCQMPTQLSPPPSNRPLRRHALPKYRHAFCLIREAYQAGGRQCISVRPYACRAYEYKGGADHA